MEKKDEMEIATSAESEKKPEEEESAKKAETESTASGNAPTDIVEDSPDKETQKVAQLSEVQSPSEPPTSPVETKAEDPKPAETKQEAVVEPELAVAAEKIAEEVQKSEAKPVLVAEPVVEAKSETVSEIKAEQVVESVPEPIVEVKTETVVVNAPEHAAEPVEKLVEQKPEPVAMPEPLEEPIVESKSESITETVPEPVIEANPETTEPIKTESEQVEMKSEHVETKSETVAEIPVVEEKLVEQEPQQSPVESVKEILSEPETLPEPVEETKQESEPVIEQKPESVVDATPEPTAEAVPEPAIVVPEPVVAEAVPEPDVIVPEPVVEAVSEPVESPIEPKSPVESPEDIGEESLERLELLPEPQAVLEPEVIVEIKQEQAIPPEVSSPLEEKAEVPVSSPMATPQNEVDVQVIESTQQEAIPTNEIPQHKQNGSASPDHSVENGEKIPVKETPSIASPTEEASKLDEAEVELPKTIQSSETNHVEQVNGVNGDSQDVSEAQVNGKELEESPSDVPTLISWKHGGEEVAVCGDFCKWEDNCLLSNNDGVFSTKIKLPKGQHHIKFLVDGKWTVDESEPVVELDGHGQVNLLVV